MIRLLVSWGPALAWAGFIFYLSSQTWTDEGPSLPISDKVAHFILFAVLGAALAWGARHLRGRNLHLGLMVLGLIYAVTDEWHQSFVPMRDPSAADLVADGLGVVAGYVFVRWLIRLRRKDPSPPIP